MPATEPAADREGGSLRLGAWTSRRGATPGVTIHPSAVDFVVASCVISDEPPSSGILIL
jgi:hypothetical protein